MPIAKAPSPWASDIQKLIDALRATPSSDTVTNPYTSADRCNNLGAYLTTLRAHGYSGHLLVGEAPGYKGCAVTGIPFTSEAVLNNGEHDFIEALRPLLKLSGEQAEATATIVWGHIETCEHVPAMWNVFPFHPHQAKKPLSNRKPSATEVARAKQFLDSIVAILEPTTVIAIGNTAADGLERQYPSLTFQRARHPSNGGKEEFLSGVKAVGVI